MADEKEPFKERLRPSFNYAGKHGLDIAAGAFMLIGIILSFFYIHLGGVLVGLGFGIGFYEEIRNFFIQARGFYAEEGVFKTVLLIGLVVYFLISIPAFVIGTVIGFGAIYLLRRSFPRD